MIVKHRRGTTEEWKVLDIAPEEGELVIEELKDGGVRCKIGTKDRKKFSELPYIDNAAIEALTSAKDKLASAITEVENSLSDRISEANLELIGTINANSTALETDYINRDNSLAEIFDAKLQDATTGLTGAIEALENRLTGGGGEEGGGSSSNDPIVFESKLKKELDNLHTSVTGEISKAKQDVTIDFESQLSSKALELTAAIEALDEQINGTIDNEGDSDEPGEQEPEEKKSLVEQLSLLQTNVQSLATDTANSLEELDERILVVDENIATQASRINNLIALPDGSTTADGELTDIRIGYDGKPYESAGDAVRAIGERLSNYITTEAVNGLHYDLTGEIDPLRPYTLYLTSNQEIIQESGVQIISAASGGGGGGSTASTLKIGYITLSPVVATTADKVVLKYSFSGTDSSGDTILQATTAWKVNGVTVEYGYAKDGENEFDVTKYLKPGTTKVLLTVTDDNKSVVTKTWSIQQIELSLKSSFDDKSIIPIGKEAVFTYTPTGAIDKTAVFVLDGKELARETLAAGNSGTDLKQVIPPQTHGAHLLEVYLEAVINEIPVRSDSVLKDLLWYDATSTLPVIGTVSKDLEVQQHSIANIVYTVYDPANEIPEVTIEVDGQTVATASVSINPDYGDTPTAVYSYAANVCGTHTIRIICGKTVKEIYIFVEELAIDVAPVTAGLVFDFNPVGKTNGDSQRLWSNGAVSMSVSNNFDWTNGGYIPDDPDGPCFCVKAGSTATIDYKLFADNAKQYGKELKLVFKTKNVSNPDAVFLSCIDSTTGKDTIGLEMGVHAANIYGQSGSLELVYSEEDVIEFEFNISKDTELVPMIMGYEDGVPSRPLVYDDTFSFKQNTAKEITIGSPDCDIYIYRFKVYNTSLTAREILDNFIADARSADELIARYTRNQIYDENNKLDPDVLAEKCPWLRVYKLSAPHFTNNKSDKVPDTTIQQLYKNGDPVLDNWICYNAQHSGQGTSSNNYGAAGRNLDFIMNKSNSYFEYGDGTKSEPGSGTITLTRNSVPVAYLNAKVNIASSNNLTNAILANRYNKFNPYTRPFVRPDGYPIDNIKDTMEFHNCVIFIQETDPDLSTHREFADTDWHFYAIGNIGDSKKTDKTRLTDPSDKYECCVEIMDVGLPLSDFPVDTMINAMGYKENETTHEKTYTWAKDENLSILYEKLEDGSYALTSDATIDLTKTYYVDILEHDDFSEDYTYGWRYISDDEDPDVINTCKRAWIDFYRFVTTSTDEEFKRDFENYFVKDSALFYYLFTTRYCMVDNRAKNTFWHYSKTGEVDSDGNSVRKWDLCWDYDNDTSLGLNNYGKQVYRYGLEDIDKDASGEEVFRESDSTFFCRVRDLFASELKAMYKDLESKDAWHAESFLNACDEWQEEFPEELWRLDIDRKYIRTYTSSFINGNGDSQFLVNMCNGKMKYQRRQWERNQEQYMASKYQTTRSSGDKYHANFRVNRFDSTDDLVIEPNYQLTLTPYSYIYLNVWYGDVTRTPFTVRAVPNQPTLVPCPSALEADIINIGNASAIRDFGDLSSCYPKTVSIGNASRVKKLTLGNEIDGYDNTAFTTFTTDANPLLEELNITNISSFTQSLNLRQLINLKTLKAFGTSIPSIIFAEGSKLSYAELPAINNITLKNLLYLSSDNFKLSSYDNVIELVVDDCPLINKADLLNKCVHANRVRLLDVDFGEVTYEYFTTKLFKLKGVSATGDETPNAWLTGSCYIAELTGSQYNEIHTRYPYLNIKFGKLTTNVTFQYTNEDGVLQTHTITVYSENSKPGLCIDPYSSLSADNIPVWPENSAFSYEFAYWSELKQESNGVYDDSYETAAFLKEHYPDAFNGTNKKAVFGDIVLYPVFKAVRKSYLVTFKNTFDPYWEDVTIRLPYGTELCDVDLDKEVVKQDEASSYLYVHTGWHCLLDTGENVDSFVCGTMEAFAQFTLDDFNGPGGADDGDTLPGYTLGLNDIEYSVINGNKLLLKKCVNNFNAAICLPSTMIIGNTTYTLDTISTGGFFDGFAGNETIELVDILDNTSDISKSVTVINTYAFRGCSRLFEITLPESLKTIKANAFADCYKLKKLNIPASVDTIEDAAFANCGNLSDLSVSAESNTFEIIDNYYLVNKNNGKLVRGIAPETGTVTIPATVKSLSPHCFSRIPIYDVDMSANSNITQIPQDAYNNCGLLTKVKLAESISIIEAMSFMGCHSLQAINLHEGITSVGTYAFNGCSLETVILPATISTLSDRAFGGISSLYTVIFKKATNEDGSIKIPDIAATTRTGESTQEALAFGGSGATSNPITFYVPWSKEAHMTKFDNFGMDPFFGANGVTYDNFVFDYDYNTEAD